MDIDQALKEFVEKAEATKAIYRQEVFERLPEDLAETFYRDFCKKVDEMVEVMRQGLEAVEELAQMHIQEARELARLKLVIMQHIVEALRNIEHTKPKDSA